MQYLLSYSHCHQCTQLDILLIAVDDQESGDQVEYGTVVCKNNGWRFKFHYLLRCRYRQWQLQEFQRII